MGKEKRKRQRKKIHFRPLFVQKEAFLTLMKGGLRERRCTVFAQIPSSICQEEKESCRRGEKEEPFILNFSGKSL